MQSARILQAVILMLVVATAASCAASKEYTSKLFTPRGVTVAKDSQAVALRFLELDQLDGDADDWVTTDIIKGKDSTSATSQLDKLAKTLPAAPDSTLLPKTDPRPVQSAPVARQINAGEVRTKKVRE